MDLIRLYFKTKKLQKIQNEIYDDFLKEKKESKNRNIQEIASSYQNEDELIEDEILELHTKYLKQATARLMLPLPEHPSYWNRSRITGMNHLSAKGLLKVRKSIREAYSPILLWIAAITGLIGAATGLVSTIGKTF
ncbi:MAG: hypothetical protein GY737_13935 [Desulfobacteraceae bacterium]|nr:hypothetical protein [Desulfobacteraceae bacterium]